MKQTLEQDELLWEKFIKESSESGHVYLLVDGDMNYAVLVSPDDTSTTPIYFAFSSQKGAQRALSCGFEDCSVVALEHEYFLHFLKELYEDNTGIILNPQAPDMIGEEYDAGDVYNELGEAWEMFED